MPFFVTDTTSRYVRAEETLVFATTFQPEAVRRCRVTGRPAPASRPEKAVRSPTIGARGVTVTVVASAACWGATPEAPTGGTPSRARPSRSGSAAVTRVRRRREEVSTFAIVGRGEGSWQDLGR